MRIYTRSGDKGTTALVYGSRVAKDDVRVEAYGTCDEANSTIGVALSHLQDVEWDGKDEFLQKLYRVQTILFHVGSELSTPLDREVAWKLKQEHIDELEKDIDIWSEYLPPLTNFILPSGHIASSTLHLARTVVRRAERLVVTMQADLRGPLPLAYLNRLSDYLFVAARYVNVSLAGGEIPLQVDM